MKVTFKEVIDLTLKVERLYIKIILILDRWKNKSTQLILEDPD